MTNIEKLILLEEQFRLNDEYGDITKPMFQFEKGRLPIIFTAPHAVKTRHISKKSGKDVMKENENFTGAFCLYLNESVGVHCMVRNNYPYNVYVDPRSDYAALVDYIKRFDIKYLVDIHGAKRKSSFIVAPGINHGKNIDYDERYKEVLTRSFNKCGVENINFESNLQGGGIIRISRYIHDYAGIKTTQLEINRDFRDVEKLVNLKKMLEALETYSINLNELLDNDFGLALKRN